MNRLLAVLIFVASLFPSISHTQTSGQIDPGIGGDLTVQLSQAQQEYLALEKRERLLSPPDRFIGTYESQLIATNMGDCESIIFSTKQEIHSLNYENAKQELTQLLPLLQATETMLQEDAAFSGDELRKVSHLDDGYAPGTSLPKLHGPALRAAIASEISFAERVANKARVSSINDRAIALVNGIADISACTNAKEKFQSQGASIGKSFGYNLNLLLSPEPYFSMANNELRLLHYSDAHELAKYAYLEGQNILSICPSILVNSR